MVTAPLGKLYDGIAERSRRLNVGLLGDQVQSSTGVAFLRCEMQRSEPVGVTGIQGDAELDELLGEDRVPALSAARPSSHSPLSLFFTLSVGNVRSGHPIILHIPVATPSNLG